MHARKTLTAAIVALAATAAAPAIASAQPNTGGGTGDSSYCQTLRDRAQRYNDLAHDPHQTQAVRDFYASRAAVTLLHARHAGCGWATGHAAVAAATAPGASARTAGRRASFRTLQRSLRVRALGATTASPGGHAPAVAPGVAYIKASPSGNAAQDDYCRKAADLIADAEMQGDKALAAGDQEGADEWYELADYMTDVSTQNGCRFVLGIKASRLRELRASGAVLTRA